MGITKAKYYFNQPQKERNLKLAKKEDSLRVMGKITEVLPNTTFRVELDEGKYKIVAYLGGKLRQNSINILLGDKVSVEMSAYDLTKGRIVYRH